ncbi:Hypothetical protein zj316_0700 [Lactiplantibacillus plantarum ZJ316]|nr:Hypothetical protein zj316_0700 [Lactiplantibacillus plantarum ZJ316]
MPLNPDMGHAKKLPKHYCDAGQPAVTALDNSSVENLIYSVN